MKKIFISVLLFAFSISLSQAAIDRRSFDEMQKGMSREQALEYFEYVKLEAEMGGSFAQLVVGMIYMGELI